MSNRNEISKLFSETVFPKKLMPGHKVDSCVCRHDGLSPGIERGSQNLSLKYFLS
jgi:hypothetical protein